MVHHAISIKPADTPRLLELSRILQGGPAKLVGPKGENAALPKPIFSLLKDIVKCLAEGDSLLLLPEKKQLTTQQAAELLGVSRPFLISLLDAGEMQYTLVGKHRRVALRDAVNYSKRRTAARKAALNKMARDAYAAGLYDNTAIPPGGRDE